MTVMYSHQKLLPDQNPEAVQNLLVLWLRLFRLRYDLYEMCGSLGHLDLPRISTRNLIVRIIRQEQLFVGVDRVANLHK